jgi:hypothetical protein
VAGLILVIRHKQNTATLGGFAALKAIQAGKDQIGGLEVLFRPSAKRHVFCGMPSYRKVSYARRKISARYNSIRSGLQSIQRSDERNERAETVI